tara:strand:+ start:2015 stop:2221 length:207 start_codon:yes stop_codon:yes gene_type:complete
MLVSKEHQNERLKICGSCDHRKNKFLAIFNMDSCGLCKCNLKAKSKLDRDFYGVCPLDKWKDIDLKFE